MQDALITADATVAATKEQVSCDLGGEAAILNLTNGVYYSLDPVGARIWQLLQQPRKIGEIRATVLAEYDVEPERCDRDLRALLQDLATERLIEVRD